MKSTPQFVTGPLSMAFERVMVGVGVVFVLSIWALCVGRFVVHGPVTEGRLAWSVGNESGSAASLLDSAPSCKSVGPRRFRCAVLDSGGSGDVTYGVTQRRSSSCWTAHLDDRNVGEPMPKDVRGCVTLVQWSVFELL